MEKRTKVLITVKTYSTPSIKYDELVCTAGVREDGSFIRLYPINYRYKLLIISLIFLIACEQERLFPTESDTEYVESNGVIQYIEISDAIRKQFVCGYRLYIADDYYRPYTLDAILHFLNVDDTNQLVPVYNFCDCDDYAEILMGRVTEAMPGIAFGLVWYIDVRTNVIHAVNVFYENGQIFFIESQNDTILVISQFWQPLLILI